MDPFDVDSHERRGTQVIDSDDLETKVNARAEGPVVW
jgi:hypothetical protein